MKDERRTEVLKELRDEIAQREQEAQDEEARARKHELQRFEREVRGTLGDELLDALFAEFKHESSRRLPYVVVRYRDCEQVLSRPGSISISREGIAQWIDKVDHDLKAREVRQNNARSEILRGAPKATLPGDVKRLHDRAQKNDLLEESDIITAIHAARDRITAEEAELEKKRAAKLEERIVQLGDEIDEAQDWVQFDELEGKVRGLRNPDILVAKLSDLEERLKEADREREGKRLALQTERFNSFCYFKVVYALFARDAESDESVVDTAHFLTLYSVQSVDGFWEQVNGRRFKPMHVVSVEEFTCTDPLDLPHWCPKESTEFGDIKVTPPGATLVKSGKE